MLTSTSDLEPRLAALYALGILDTPAEEKFDRITRLALRLFGVSAAMIVLVDAEVHRIKSAAGTSARELTRDSKLFFHSIQQTGILQITDVAADVRFASQQLAGKPLHFYACCALHSSEGHRLGLLCLFDHRPRALDAGELLALQDLADIVENEFCALELASHDALTRIPNRRGFMLLAQQNLAFCARQGCAGSLVILELAALKAINDTHGRSEGDLVLLVFSDQIRKAFRGSDSFARISADQFAVFLANVSTAQATAVFARFAEAIQQYNREAGREYLLTYTSVIVEFSSAHDATLDQLLSQAEAALHQLKNPSPGN